MIIDCDCHFFPRDAFEHMSDSLRARAPRLVYSTDNVLVDIEFPGRPEQVHGTTPNSPPGSGARYVGMSDMGRRVADYVELGIERQMMLPQFTGWWSYLIEPELGTAMAHSYNVAAASLAAEQADAIHPVALVALQDVDGAVAELEWAHVNGFRAAVLDHTFPVHEHPYGTPTATHRETWPFFAKCEELGMPVYFHAVQHGHRMVNLMNYQVDGMDLFTPSEPQMNLVAMITSGLLDRYPRLQVVHAELGAGRIRPMAEALDDRYHKLEGDYENADGFNAITRRKLGSNTQQLVEPETIAEKNEHAPSHYFRENFSWTIETEEPALADGVAYLGAKRFLFATDYPHDDPGGSMKFRDVELLAADDRFTEDQKEQMRWRNAAALFGVTV